MRGWTRYSVRTRLALVVSLWSVVGFSVAALVAPQLVGRVLEEDLIQAEAELMLQFTPLPLPPDQASESEFEITDDEVRAALDASLAASFGTNDRLVQLHQAAGGPFAVVFDADTYARLMPDGSYEIETGPIDQLDIPLTTEFELDETLFFDFAVDDMAMTDALDSSAERTTIATDVVTIDGIDLLVSAETGSVARSQRRVSLALWLGVPLLALTLGGVAWLLAGRALRPVRAITARASTISAGSLDARVPVPESDDEVADLATTMNDMLERLETDDRRRRHFISDASHELRSPVAVLKNEAEVALRHPGESDATELANAVAEESERMAAIIHDLLALARHDEQADGLSTEVDLDDVVLAEARRERRVLVDTSQVSAGRVRGDAEEFGRMVGHLLDNASRHAASEVRVILRTQGDHVVLTIDDDGPGVPLQDRMRIFERFTRLDEARSRDRGGAGLGLAVVSSIARRAGGDAVVGDAELGGARFTVTLPA